MQWQSLGLGRLISHPSPESESVSALTFNQGLRHVSIMHSTICDIATNLKPIAVQDATFFFKYNVET